MENERMINFDARPDGFLFFVRTAVSLALAAILLGLPMETGPSFAAQPSRILSIGGAVTEFVYALGEEARLVGRDSTSTFPPDANNLPNVGYIRALSPEGVLSVKPDLILARENNGPPEAVEVLKKTGITWIDIPDDFTVQGIKENIAIISSALNVEEKGRRLAAEISIEFEETAEILSGIEQRKKIMFVLSMNENRIVAAGKDTAADSIINLAGAVNVLTAFDGYKPVSDEAVLAAAPEIIIMMRRAGEDNDHSPSDQQLIDHPALSQTPAVMNGDILHIDGLLMLGFGPRTARAALQLSKAIYGKISY